MKTNHNYLKASEDLKKDKISNSSNTDFFCLRDVKQCKDEALKIRLQTLIRDRGLTEPEFYNKIGLSRQHWYAISWGIWECTLNLRLKISKALNVDSSLIFENKKELENEEQN